MASELVIVTSEDAIASFNEAERQVYDELRELIYDTTLQEIEQRYKVAKKVHEVYYKAKEEGSIYRQQFLKRLAIALGFKSDSVFREMILVVDRWPTFEQLKQEVLDTVRNINWKKLVYLRSWDSEEIKQASSEVENMSATDLQRLCKTDNPRPGRSPDVADNLDDFLSEITSRCKSLCRRVEESWMSFEFDEEELAKAFENDDKVLMWDGAISAINELVEKLTQLSASMTDLIQQG